MKVPSNQFLKLQKDQAYRRNEMVVKEVEQTIAHIYQKKITGTILKVQLVETIVTLHQFLE